EPQAHARIQFPELRVDRRQQGIVVLATQTDEVVESIETGIPGNEPRSQVLEVEVVLQRGLEVVRCHYLHEVVSFRRVRQAAQADDPVFVLPALLADQRVEKASFPDAADRCIDSLNLL